MSESVPPHSSSSSSNNTLPSCRASNSCVIHQTILGSLLSDVLRSSISRFISTSCDISTSRSNTTVGEVDHDPPPRLSGIDFIASLHTIYGYLTGLLLTLTGIKYQGSSSNLFSKHPTLVMLLLITILVYIISLITLRRSNHMMSNHSSKLMNGVCHISGGVACELLLLVLVSPMWSLVINVSSLSLIAMSVLCYNYILLRISDADQEGRGISQIDAGGEEQGSQMEMVDVEAALCN